MRPYELLRLSPRRALSAAPLAAAKSRELARIIQHLDAGVGCLQRAKEHVLDFFGSRALSAEGKRGLCFVGPSGSGKHTMFRALQRALDVPAVSLSVMGAERAEDLRGVHGAGSSGSGRLSAALARLQTPSPLLLVEDVDRVETDAPVSVLLDLLHPIRAGAFADGLGRTVDASRAVVVFTATHTADLPPALRDFVHVIDFPGYTPAQKETILRQFFLPELQRSLIALHRRKLKVTPSALRMLTRRATREAGLVQAQSILRGVVGRACWADESEGPLVIDDAALKDYVGSAPLSLGEPCYQKTPAGVAAALSVNNVTGGGLTFCEVVVDPHKTDGAPSLQVTGSVGDIMRESADISALIARRFVARNARAARFLASSSLHMHFPDAVVAKNGPSAGVAMVVALISLALRMPLLPRLALTGEVSLNGRILGVGGILHKLIGAHRDNIRTVIVPSANRSEVELMEPEVTRGLDIRFVATLDDVVSAAFDAAAMEKKLGRSASKGTQQ